MQQKKQKIHFIAIGGSVMHNLAVALKQGGHEVSGSDDEIVDPSRSTLANMAYCLIQRVGAPAKSHLPGRRHPGDARQSGQPRALKAQQLGLRIFSFPEYIYEHSKNKQRIVIAGSHGKTTITAIVITCSIILNINLITCWAPR